MSYEAIVRVLELFVSSIKLLVESATRCLTLVYTRTCRIALALQRLKAECPTLLGRLTKILHVGDRLVDDLYRFDVCCLLEFTQLGLFTVERRLECLRRKIEVTIHVLLDVDGFVARHGLFEPQVSFC